MSVCVCDRIFNQVKKGPVTAGRLAKRLRLSKLTVYRWLSVMQRVGTVQVIGEAAEKRRGPKARVYGAILNG